MAAAKRRETAAAALPKPEKVAVQQEETAPAAAVPGRGHVGRRVGGRWGFTGDRWAAVSAGSRHPAREWARALARLAPFNLFGAPFK